jgi:hypothetical protein
MSTKPKKPKVDHLKELKEQVLKLEMSSSHGEVREAMRQVMALIEEHQKQ